MTGFKCMKIKFSTVNVICWIPYHNNKHETTYLTEPSPVSGGWRVAQPVAVSGASTAGGGTLGPRGPGAPTPTLRLCKHDNSQRYTI